MSEIASRLTRALAGRCRIARELGAGGMATVYLAEDLRHERKVALKVLKPELAAVLGGERFVHEIRTTAARNPVVPPPGNLNVMVDWFEELRRLLAQAGNR